MQRDMRSLLDLLTPAGRQRVADRERELRQSALDYRELLRSPGWAALKEHVEAQLAAGMERYGYAPTLPCDSNPMGLPEVVDRQRAEWFAEARAMRELMALPGRVLTEARQRGLLDDVELGEKREGT